MKALNIYIGIIVILALCGGAYMVFFYHPGDVQEIMEKNKKEKADFESKINGYKAREVELDKIIKDQEAEIVEAENKQKATEMDRLAWIDKYDNAQKEYDEIKETNKPKSKAEFRALNEGQKIIEYGKLKINLDITESRLIECETGLDKNKALLIEYKATLNLQVSQIKNFENGMALKIERIVEMEFELNRREATIQELKKVPTKINFKKAAIYTGIVFVGTKLLQVIFGK